LLVVSLACLTGCGAGDDSDDGDGSSTNNVPPTNISTVVTIVHDFGRNNRNIYVAMGDSITGNSQPGAGITYPARLSQMLDKAVVNEGIAGERTAEGLARINRVLDESTPGFILLLYGANDMIQSRPGERILGYLATMVDRAYNRKTIPVIATLLPMVGEHEGFADKVDRMNVLIRDYAARENIVLVDLHEAFQPDPESFLSDDGLHPNRAGTELIARSFYDVLTNIVVVAPEPLP